MESTDYMEKLGMFVGYKPPERLIAGIQNKPETTKLDRISKISGVDELAEILKNRYSKHFKTNTTVHDFDYNVKFKPNFKPVQQKGRVVPIHLQPLVKTEIEKLIDEGHVVREH